MIVQKQQFQLAYTFEDGQEIPLTLGYETYGTLNEARDNAIYIAHYFSASSHAAGKYHADDAAPGYWDALIGPGKVIDTERFFVVSIDNVCNVAPYLPNVVTTGPTSINPKKNQPYGLDFPVFTYRDMAKIAHQFLSEQLGISQLYLAMGASAGGFQVLELGCEFPTFAKRITGVITNAQNPTWTSLTVLQPAMRVLELDANWPTKDAKEGLQLAVQMMNTGAFTSTFYEKTYPRIQDDEATYTDLKIPATYEVALSQTIKQNLPVLDPTHWYYTCKATMLQDLARQRGSLQEAAARFEADVLLISCDDDLLQPSSYNAEFITLLKNAHKTADHFHYQSTYGHMAGILDIKPYENRLKEFLK